MQIGITIRITIRNEIESRIRSKIRIPRGATVVCATAVSAVPNAGSLPVETQPCHHQGPPARNALLESSDTQAPVPPAFRRTKAGGAVG